MKMNIKLPRRTWQFNPATWMKQSVQRYTHARAKLTARRQIHE
jgi:hypothetical protein